MKKHIIICTTIGTTVGNYYENFAKELSKNEYNIWIVSDKYRIKESTNNITYAFWPTRRPNTIKSLFFFIKLIIKVQPNIVISNFGSTFIVTWISYLFGIKHRINHYHTPSVQMKLDFNSNFIREYLQRVTLSKNTVIIVASNYVKKDVLEKYKVDLRKILVLPFLLERIKGKEVNSKVGGKTIFYPGRLNNSKGQLYFIDNILLELVVIYPDIKVYFNGEGPLENVIKERINDNSLHKNVIIQKPTSYEKYIENLLACDLACGFSLSEGFGLVFLEQMAANVPFITNNIAPMNEFVKNEISGFLINLGDEKQAIKYICKIFNDSEYKNNFRLKQNEYFDNFYEVHNNMKKNTLLFLNFIN
jgi:glycosyltransferase involved in cell wall biosynthesis